MNSRRNFFKYLGLAGGVAAGGAVAAAAVIPDSSKSLTVSEIENNSSGSSLQFQQTYGHSTANFHNSNEERLRIYSDQTIGIGHYNEPKENLKVVQINMTPGPDGELYLKTNGKWKKVVTE